MAIDRLEEKLADKLKISGNIKLTATSVKEFDELMVKIETLKQNCPTMEMVVSAQWEVGATIPSACNEGKNINKLVFKGIRNFLQIVKAIRDFENNLNEMLNKIKNSDEYAKYAFSCTISLKIEKKDKEAKRVLEDSTQLKMFGPLVIPDKDDDKRQFIEDNKKLFESLMPDGKEIEKITFTHRQDGVEGETVELNAK
jgi:hypothetical protein